MFSTITESEEIIKILEGAEQNFNDGQLVNGWAFEWIYHPILSIPIVHNKNKLYVFGYSAEVKNK